MRTSASEPEPVPDRRSRYILPDAGAGAGMLPWSRSQSRSRPKMSRLRIPGCKATYSVLISSVFLCRSVYEITAINLRSLITITQSFSKSKLMQSKHITSVCYLSVADLVRSVKRIVHFNETRNCGSCIVAFALAKETCLGLVEGSFGERNVKYFQESISTLPDKGCRLHSLGKFSRDCLGTSQLLSLLTSMIQ